MTPFRCVLGSVILIACGHALQESAAPQPQPAESPDGVYLLIRSDDAGMSHAVNMAAEKLLETGLPVSTRRSRRRWST